MRLTSPATGQPAPNTHAHQHPRAYQPNFHHAHSRCQHCGTSFLPLSGRGRFQCHRRLYLPYAARVLATVVAGQSRREASHCSYIFSTCTSDCPVRPTAFPLGRIE
ncbi:hypothetical protein T440DRAFT_155703 [Plenodomus tracheiphilus IPT5]|uniref:Uncharacterized protein n=1 Tax=Plenodomus tracheiphilus IPT5 TaxID=1408161 RepID=A0A6A7BM08_9PLEO|nr:hypothetical protein T440DRAFT_155703 [Plenodomus tracheiphilus IPT5]